MNKLSGAVSLTKTMAKEKGIGYGLAAHKVLQSMGFQKPKETHVEIANIVNDIGASPKDSLITAVTRKCAQDGVRVRLWKLPRPRKETSTDEITHLPVTIQGSAQFQLALS